MKNILLHLEDKLKSTSKSVLKNIYSEFTNYNFNEKHSDFKNLHLPTVPFLSVALLGLVVFNNTIPGQGIIKKEGQNMKSLQPLTNNLSSTKEVFGFIPFWNFDKLSSLDFSALTTLAYFGAPVNADGSLDKSGPEYQTFKSEEATNLFKQAHASGTRVVLTLTQMDGDTITSILDNPEAQKKLINEAISEVDSRGIDGINIDFEYGGDPGQSYRDSFGKFVGNLTAAMHQKNPESKVTVSVYATAVKDHMLYDIATLSRSSDGIFMMAYDFAVAQSHNAIPTSPLYGHQDGKYWYDVSTAVSDFLSVMPAQKLILGVPWYGYNYLVSNPSVDSPTLPASWKGSPNSQTYESVQNTLKSDMAGISDYREGWDSDGKVGWKAYFETGTQVWRMIFVEDTRSLGIKYDFAKQNNLGGVGIWALGNENGKSEMWSLIKDKFGVKFADNLIQLRAIT